MISCFASVIAVAVIGSGFTKIDEWYESVKPSITPPNFVFPIAWTILFFLIALSFYFSLTNSNKKQRIKIIILFGINFLLNILWSYFYFTMHNPLIAFFDLIVLLISIIAIAVFCWKPNRISSYLLTPYLIWVGFAGVLNYLTIL